MLRFQYNFILAMSEQHKGSHSIEQKTIEEGESFKNSHIPKVVNLDQKLHESYPEGYFDNLNHKRSSRKSARKSISHSRKSQTNTPNKTNSSKKDRSATKSRQGSPKRSEKKSALKLKSEKKKKEEQVEASKKKIKGTKTMNSTIKEGHSFISKEEK